MVCGSGKRGGQALDEHPGRPQPDVVTMIAAATVSIGRRTVAAPVGSFAWTIRELRWRSRDGLMLASLLDQQRAHLDCVEAERGRLYVRLDDVVPEIASIQVGLSKLLGNGENNAATSARDQFGQYLSALAKLEAVAYAISANLLRLRSVWQQHTATAADAARRIGEEAEVRA